MEASPTRSKERKGSGLSPAATSLTGGSKPSLSRSEEFLSQISTELTDEALFVAGYRVNPVPSKKMQTQDQATQIYKHEYFTKSQGTGTDARSHVCTKARLPPSRRDQRLAEVGRGIHEEGIKELIVTDCLLSVSICQVQQAMRIAACLTEAAASKVHDQEQRQIQLTTSPVLILQDLTPVPLGHLLSPSWCWKQLQVA